MPWSHLHGVVAYLDRKRVVNYIRWVQGERLMVLRVWLHLRRRCVLDEVRGLINNDRVSSAWVV